MFQVCVVRNFIAQHFLIGADFGRESERHSHAYRAELILEGPELDAHGFLVDIVEVERGLDAQIARVADRTLNDLPELTGQNPSLERFARLLCQGVAGSLDTSRLSRVELRLWESETAWASYRHT